MTVRSTRRGSAAVLLILAFLLVPAVERCTGWDGTASERHACCATADDGHTANDADACCAAGEQRQHAETVGSGLVMMPTSMSVLCLPAVPLVLAVRPSPFEAKPNWRTSADTRLLLSVFLI